MRPTSANREAIRAAAESAVSRNEDIWCVRTDEPLGRIFCKDGMELARVAGALMCVRERFEVMGTNVAGVSCVEPSAPVTVLAVPDSFMPGLMAALRANGAHGTYRKAGTEREYRF